MTEPTLTCVIKNVGVWKKIICVIEGKKETVNVIVPRKFVLKDFQ